MLSICAGDTLDVSFEQDRIVLSATGKKICKARIINDPHPSKLIEQPVSSEG